MTNFSEKRKIRSLVTLVLLLSSFLFVCVSTVVPAFATLINVSEGTYFLAQYEGHTYKCYHLEDEEGQAVPGVAIAWGEDAENTPTTLNLPSSVTHSGDTYAVRAIAKHGFRFCSFEIINLPTSIELIEEEAFAYCTNMTSFTIPYLVDKIAPSTFLDCRELESIYYLDAIGNPAFGNTSITEIGDHAFDSCVSLKDFYTPKNCTLFGEGCFKNCRSLVNFYFPSAIRNDGGQITNYLTVRPYAFADCANLTFMYFETNMREIDNYAFVDCNTNLRIKYNGTNVPSYKREGTNQAYWRRAYIASGQSKNIPVDYKHPTIISDDHYPCLRYTVENSVVPLDAAQDKPTQIEVITQQEINDEGEYAVIYKFDTPNVTIPGCFDVSTGALTIPDTVDGKTVKIINANAFANNLNIKSVKFNANLVQIKNQAFYNCTEITSLDFDSCVKLKEVSYKIFNNGGGDTYANKHITRLDLPECLEFIGGHAFSCLYNVNYLDLPDHLRAFDDLAFYRLGYSISAADAAIDIVFPKSLNDADAEKAYFKHFSKGQWNHNDYTRFYAIGKYGFNEAKAVRTATMEDDPDHANDLTYTTSLYSNVFNGASNLIRFKANQNLKHLGKDVFKNATGLREVFLTYTKSESSTENYPWCINEEDGTYGGTLFWGACPECVCYVDGPKAPKDLDNYKFSLSQKKSNAQENSTWNAETSTADTSPAYNNYLGKVAWMRSHVPTFYNVDFDNGIKYWNPKNNTFLPNPPMTLTDYKSGFIIFAKNKVTNNYSTVKYYCDINTKTGYKYIDLTNVPGISDGTTNLLTTIGECSFAQPNYKNQQTDNTDENLTAGLYFILPTTVTKIEERAFYRESYNNNSVANGRFGARIVTYKTGADSYVGEDGTAITSAQLTSYINTLENMADNNRYGYCAISDSVTYIGKDAFFGNIFKNIHLPNTLTFIGNTAFFTHRDHGAGKVVNITMSGSNSNFAVSNNGIYFIGGGDSKKILISQATGNSGVLNIAANTKAIGLGGCASTQYTTINLPTGLTTIYGAGLAKNDSATDINNVESLRYIGAMENLLNSAAWSDDGYTEVWDDSIMDSYTSNYDYRDYSYKPDVIADSLYGAFAGCGSLKNINFKAMTELRKIGPKAFDSCKKLEHMAGTNTYNYKNYNSSTNTLTDVDDGRTDKSANVLDLTSCTHLRSIGANAFVECGSIKYIHLPDNKNGADESTLYISKDPETPTANSSILSNGKGTKVLVGETAFYAHHDFGKAKKAQNHYPANCFSSSGNTICYYCATSADVPNDDATTLQYWTKNGDDFVFLGNANSARVYFQNH